MFHSVIWRLLREKTFLGNSCGPLKSFSVVSNQNILTFLKEFQNFNVLLSVLSAFIRSRAPTLLRLTFFIHKVSE